MGSPRFSTPSWRAWLSLLLLIVVAYLSHFLLSGLFGLYEDDYRAIAPWMGASAAEVGDNFLRTLKNWPQGRPFNHSLPEMMAWLGWRLGGLHGIYLLGFAFFALNVGLVFAMGSSLHGREAGFVAAAVYVLFPADTTRQFLTHCGHVQTSMTFFLVAALLLLRRDRWRWAAYPVAFLSLLSYETCYLLFLLFPLVQARPSKRWLWQSAVHLLLCGGSIGTVVLVRINKGEDRMVSVLGDHWQTAYELAAAPFIGVWTSALRFGESPLEAFAHAPSQAALLGLSVAVLIAAGIWLSRPHEGLAIVAQKTTRDPRQQAFWLGPNGLTAPGFVAVYLLTWLASYAFTFTNFPPSDRVGRQTSYHMAGALPACLLAAEIWKCLGHALLARGARKARTLATAVLALYGGLLAAYLYQVQLGYAQSWAVQKTFWQQVIALCPEFRPGVTIIVAGRLNQESAFIKAHCVQDFRLAQALFDPKTALFSNLPEKVSAVLALDTRGGPYRVRREQGKLEWSARPWIHHIGWMPIDEQNLILLRSDSGRLSRVASVSHKRLPEELKTNVQPARVPHFSGPDTQTPLARCLLE